ncbi:ATP-binding cassette domain-containing protein [Lewinella sp. IMCC34191]|uniref:ATP-binding cassette domain-containing protein n=1 Tax=Lewinella sp. IMCC34191 TaxID=2259172 RepID=UPI000E247205|nr:ABC transporter ATP-binding protein [Lewinella sp. IMCC34191]
MKINNLSFGYGNTLIFEDVTIELAAGKIYGLIGPNGVGKTTLLSILAGIQRKYGGSVEGIDKPGLLLQNTSFYDNLTGAENLRLVCYEKGIDPRRVEEALRWVAIPPDLSVQKFSTYSQGYRQRLGIARSLLTDSPLVLLDEPFTAVDVDTIGALKKAIVQYVSETNRTIMLSSHQLREIEDILDLTLLVKDHTLIPLQTANLSTHLEGRQRIYVTFPPDFEALDRLDACPYIQDFRAISQIVMIQMRQEGTVSLLVDWLESHRIEWRRIDRNMPLEFLYATHSA